MAYSREQFETAYRATVQFLHGLRYVETAEVIRWVMDLTEEQLQAAPEKREGVDRLLEILREVHQLRETLKVKGIPPMPPYRGDASQPMRGQTGNG